MKMSPNLLASFQRLESKSQMLNLLSRELMTFQTKECWHLEEWKIAACLRTYFECPPPSEHLAEKSFVKIEGTNTVNKNASL